MSSAGISTTENLLSPGGPAGFASTARDRAEQPPCFAGTRTLSINRIGNARACGAGNQPQDQIGRRG